MVLAVGPKLKDTTDTDNSTALLLPFYLKIYVVFFLVMLDLARSSSYQDNNLTYVSRKLHQNTNRAQGTRNKEYIYLQSFFFSFFFFRFFIYLFIYSIFIFLHFFHVYILNTC